MAPPGLEDKAGPRAQLSRRTDGTRGDEPGDGGLVIGVGIEDDHDHDIDIEIGHDVGIETDADNDADIDIDEQTYGSILRNSAIRAALLLGRAAQAASVGGIGDHDAPSAGLGRLAASDFG